MNQQEEIEMLKANVAQLNELVLTLVNKELPAYCWLRLPLDDTHIQVQYPHGILFYPNPELKPPQNATQPE